MAAKCMQKEEIQMQLKFSKFAEAITSAFFAHLHQKKKAKRGGSLAGWLF